MENQAYYYDTRAREYWTVQFHNGLFRCSCMDSDERVQFDSLPASWVKVFWDINGDVRRGS